MEPLPANYVTLSQLKERYLKEKERERKEKEEEEQRKKKEEEQLRQRKLREEEARFWRPDGVFVVRNRGRFERREFRPVNRIEFRPVERRELRPVDRSVSECEGGEVEKSEEAEEEKSWKKKRNKKQNRKKSFWTEKEEVRSKKEGVAVEVVEESSEKGSDGSRRTGGVEIRVKGKNGEEIEPKSRDLGIGGETERRNDRPRRRNNRNVGAKEEVEPKGRDFGVNGETERGNDRRRRENGRNGAAREDLRMNGGSGRGSDKLRGANSKEEIQESERKYRVLHKHDETESGDRLRGANSEESEPKVRGLAMTGESEGGEDRLRRLKGKNVGGKDETGPKVVDSLVKAESEREDERLRSPSRSDYRGNGKTWGHNRWAGLAWVKKGEVSDGNVVGVQSLEHSISGSNRVTSNGNSLKSAGARRVIQYRGSEINAN